MDAQLLLQLYLAIAVVIVLSIIIITFLVLLLIFLLKRHKKVALACPKEEEQPGKSIYSFYDFMHNALWHMNYSVESVHKLHPLKNKK